MKSIFIITNTIILLTGCSANNSNEYQPYSAPGGFKDKRLGENIYEVEYHGNSETSKETVIKYWKRRAYELCPQGFKVLKKKPETNKNGLIIGRSINYPSVYPVHKLIINCKE